MHDKDCELFGGWLKCKCEERRRKQRLQLPANTRELLLALHHEFYSGPRAHADAFRILPLVVENLEEFGAIPKQQEAAK